MRAVVALLLLSLTVAVSGASAQSYPSKPIRLVAAPPGGSGDFTARLIAHGISPGLGQPVVVENRPPVVGIDTVLKAPPDGYAAVVASNSLWIGPLLREKPPYDALKDFSTITLAVTAPLLLVVHPSLPSKNVRELIALAKARPGQLSYASGAAGGATHLATELFKAMGGVEILRVPYKSGAMGMNALMGGEVQLTFENNGTVAPHIKSGRMRALAVSSQKPSAVAPQLPPIATSGLPGYEATSTIGVFAPGRTPAASIKLLNEEMVRALRQPDTKEKLFSIGLEVMATSPEDSVAALNAELIRFGKVIKDAGIREE